MKADSAHWMVMGPPATPAEQAALDRFRDLRPEDGITTAWVNPDGRSAPIAMDDIGCVAASVLLSSDHVGRALSLTGPEVLTRVEPASRIGGAIGAPVEFVTVPRDEAVAELVGVMGADAAWYVDTVLAGNVGNPVEVTTLVEDVTGKPATTFAAWARANAAAFRG